MAPHVDSLFVLDQSEGGVMELNERSAARLAQGALHVRNDRMGHEQRPCDFKQRWPPDGLHMSPEMALPSPRSRYHLSPGHGSVLRGMGVMSGVGATSGSILRSNLFKKHVEGLIERPADVNSLG
jgi:hypothetical protein